jgi:hypothetical protein
MNVSSFSDFSYEIVNQKIQEGKKIRFDIGTSISAPVTRHWFNHFNDRYVIGIEPNPDCYDQPNSWQGRFWNIKDEFESHPQGDNYYHVIGACDNVDSIVEKSFYLLSGNVGCSSLLEPKIHNIKGCAIDKVIKVETFPLYLMLNQIKYDIIELIKIDAQGKDLDIVKSLRNHLKNICYLDIEDDSTVYYHSAANHKEIMEYMTENGFEFYSRYSDNLRFINKIIDIPKDYNNLSGDM